MTPIEIGILIGIVTVLVLAAGVPIAFGLGVVALGFLFYFQGADTFGILGEKFFGGIATFELVALPMFILMGAAVASSPAGRDVYLALDRWMNRVPGGIVISNIGACSIFAALSGSSPATCAAIGKMGIPEMRKRGVPDDLATGSIAAGGTLGILIPPSITMIVYGVATETSIGRLFLAGVFPGLMLTGLFIAWTWFVAWRRGVAFTDMKARFSLRERLEVLPKVLPLLLIVVGILYVLYGGVATPSEAAGVGAMFCLVLVAVIYRIWQPARIWTIFRDTTRESVMIMMIIAASELFGYMMSVLYVTQSVAEWIAVLEVNRWVLMFFINIFLLVAGCFLPPVAIILMTAPILIPIITNAGFDPYWFAVILTVNMEIGLITPPVGLNLYVINGIAPEIRLPVILRGAVPFILLMVLGIVILSIFPGIATWLPDYLMGPTG
ncbi:C4-dicarboxylate ABC transporter [Sulfurifustis variabilis]|uniref:TRAP transporter large permease protein n=1 Tax=Sulfurifustis variabilis TaxID=1675686 RepID=A0A1B4V366_9GAMM|nr:TRAP transporter large permease [Sulfurifustis variabilis]BAU48006.1 C4-dicarboxylate ABC transporter [Sulfurifustis variabilis]